MPVLDESGEDWAEHDRGHAGGEKVEEDWKERARWLRAVVKLPGCVLMIWSQNAPVSGCLVGERAQL